MAAVTQTTVSYNGTAITGESFIVNLRRGRSRELDEFQSVAGTVTVNNYQRNFDPPWFTVPDLLHTEAADELTLESGDTIALDQTDLDVDTTGGDYGAIELGGTITIDDGAVRVFTGHVEDINYRWTAEKQVSATIVLGDLFTSLASTQFRGQWTGTDGELSGVRLEALLSRPDVDIDPSAYTASIDAGSIRLQDDSVTEGTNVLQYAQTIARTEWGKFYLEADGTLQFNARYNFPSKVASVRFGEGDSFFPFSEVDVVFGSERRAWTAAVQRQDGVMQWDNGEFLPSDDGGSGETVETYNQTGAPGSAQSFTVPDNVFTIEVQMLGGGGGQSDGGGGGLLTFTWSVTPGTQYDLYVPTGGGSGPGDAGLPGGGNGGSSFGSDDGGGGGGYAAIIPTGGGITDAVAVAGGGGGGGGGSISAFGGGGGYTEGEDAGGGGGTQDAGGTAGSGATAGSQGQGGAGRSTHPSTADAGGGGGGGWYGGGGGGSGQGGGGGSSYVSSSAVTSGVTHVDDSGTNAADGQIVLTYTPAPSPTAALGRRTISYTNLLFREDAYSRALARHIADTYSRVNAFVERIRVPIRRLSTSDRATICGLEIDDTVALSWTPTGTGTQIYQTLVVEGVEYYADSGGEAYFDVQCSQMPNQEYFTLDVDYLDSGVQLGF